VLLHVRQDQDVGMRGLVELIDDVRLRLAEPTRKAQKLRGAKALAAENQNLRGEERIPDFAEVRRDRVGLGAESRAQFSQLHAFSFGTSSHFFCFQLFSPSSASCTPFAPSSRFQRNLPSPATCLRNSSHCALKALS